MEEAVDAPLAGGVDDRVDLTAVAGICYEDRGVPAFLAVDFDGHLRRGARDSGDAVVLGHPEAVIAQPFRRTGELHGVAQSLRGRVPFAGAGPVEDGEFPDHTRL